MHKTELDRIAIGLMVLFCTIWGVQQVAIKLASAGISPVWQAGLRSIGATVLVFAWARLRGVRLFAADGTLWAGILAGLLFAAEFAMIFLGLQYTTASRGVIFLYTAPFFVALGAVWLLPHEHLRRAQWTGMALAFCGVLLLFGEHLFTPADRAWVGDLMILLAAVFWAATTLTVKASALARASAEKTLLYQLAVSALALPLLSTIICIFVFKASFDAVPRSLIDAARIDGLSDLRILMRVMMPLAKPAIATNVILAFIWSWNNFLWPLIITRDESMQTLPLGLARFLSIHEDTTGALYAFCVMVLAPGIVVFLMAQKEFVRGLTSGATKG